MRDAAARLPNGEGTRAEICELLKDSQFLAPDVTSAQVGYILLFPFFNVLANFVDLSCLFVFFFGDYVLYAKHFSFPFRLTQLSVGHWIDFTMRRTPV